MSRKIENLVYLGITALSLTYIVEQRGYEPLEVSRDAVVALYDTTRGLGEALTSDSRASTIGGSTAEPTSEIFGLIREGIKNTQLDSNGHIQTDTTSSDTCQLYMQSDLQATPTVIDLAKGESEASGDSVLTTCVDSLPDADGQVVDIFSMDIADPVSGNSAKIYFTFDKGKGMESIQPAIAVGKDICIARGCDIHRYNISTGIMIPDITCNQWEAPAEPNVQTNVTVVNNGGEAFETYAKDVLTAQIRMAATACGFPSELPIGIYFEPNADTTGIPMNEGEFIDGYSLMPSSTYSGVTDPRPDTNYLGVVILGTTVRDASCSAGRIRLHDLLVHEVAHGCAQDPKNRLLSIPFTPGQDVHGPRFKEARDIIQFGNSPRIKLLRGAFLERNVVVNPLFTR